MQPAIGMLPATLVFALLHIGRPQRKVLPFFLFVFGFGLVFGWLRELGLSLSALILAHGLVDLIGFYRITRGAAVEQPLP